LQKGAMDRQVEREGAYDDKLTNAMAGLDMSAMPPGMKAAFDINKEFGLNQYLNFEQQKQLNELNKPPVKPVKLVNVYNATNYNQNKSFPEGSAELIAATENGKFIIGNAPPPGPGYAWGPNNTLIVKKSGSEAFKRLSEYAKPVAENMNKYAASKSAYDQGASLFVQGTGSADVGLIYKFFGALEPTGKVTEGEATMTKLAASYGQQLSAKLKNAFKTGMFLPETRKELVNVMRNIIVVQQKDLKSIFSQDSFKDRFNELGITFKQHFPTYDITFEPISDLPTLSNSNNSNVGGDINIGNEGTGNQISTVIKNSKTNDLINSLTKN